MGRPVLSGWAAFANHLLWYLGCLFPFFGLLAGGTAWVPNLRPATGYSIIVGSIILVAFIALRCKVGFWPAVAVWGIGFVVVLLFLAIPTPILVLLSDNRQVWWIFDQFGFIGFLAIGAILLLNRWLASRRRARAEAAATAAAFD
jgi:hypothetical protein